MNSTRLSDLDELVQVVRDPVSRSYVLESINAYRGGAFRAAIVSTWVAVIYDIVAKLRELALSADRAASLQIAELDRAIQNDDHAAFLRIEGQLLEVAHQQFELVTRHELEDLDRLRKDRHLCAHPAFVQQESLFQPSPELVRTHIVHAVGHLLRHQPVQGKAALKRMLDDIISETFPRDLEQASRFLNARYFDRAREALVRNATITLLKLVLIADDPDIQPAGHWGPLTNSLMTIGRRHPDLYEEVMKDRLPEIASNLDDNRVINIYRLLGADSRTWGWLGDPTRIRVREHLSKFKFESQPWDLDQPDPEAVFGALAVDELVPIFHQSFGDVNPSRRAAAISANPRAELTNTVIDQLWGADGFRNAESILSKMILPMSQYFSASDINEILTAARENPQIWDASGTPGRLTQLFDDTRSLLPSTLHSWQRFLEHIEEMEQSAYYAGLIARASTAQDRS